MLDIAYLAVSFSAGGVFIGAAWYWESCRWDRKRIQLESDNSCLKWERDSLRESFDSTAAKLVAEKRETENLVQINAGLRAELHRWKRPRDHRGWFIKDMAA